MSPAGRSRTVAEALAAFEAGGAEGLLPYLTEDVVWADDPEWPDAQVSHGREAVQAIIEERLDTTSIQPELEGMEERGDRVLAWFRWRAVGEASGATAVLLSRRPVRLLGRPDRAGPLLPRPRTRLGGVRGPERMRVVAGEFGGRRLRARAVAGTRPTADRVREALFSMLGDVSGARVLDLYAGSGALGIEALSRGAAERRLRGARRARRRRDRAQPRRAGARGARGPRRRPAFPRARPGGRSTSCSATRHMIPAPASPDRSPSACRRLLADDARIVTESDKRKPLELPFPLLRERSYGDTRIAIHGR